MDGKVDFVLTALTTDLNKILDVNNADCTGRTLLHKVSVTLYLLLIFIIKSTILIFQFFSSKNLLQLFTKSLFFL